MARPLRVEFPGAYYHVMNRGLDRQPVFEREADHGRFVDLLADVATRWDVKVMAYCCMKTHYHLFLQTPRGNVSRVMRHVDGLYTQRFNRARGRDGPLFRGRYKALLVDADAYLLQLVRYIHLNPVEAGVARSARAYPWSSHPLYLASKKPGWLAWQEVLGRFSNLGAFERFVAEGNEAALRDHMESGRRSPFLGDGGFLAAAIRRARPSREHARKERTPQFPSLGAVVQAVIRKTGRTSPEIVKGRRGRTNNARNLAIYVSSRVAGFPNAEIRRHFGLGSDSAVTKACVRADGLLRADGRAKRLLKGITAQQEAREERS
ncbi:MAG: transposase [Nitrospirae bacterium]|nr:transposase [Nitrospirota bacterium]